MRTGRTPSPPRQDARDTTTRVACGTMGCSPRAAACPARWPTCCCCFGECTAAQLIRGSRKSARTHWAQRDARAEHASSRRTIDGSRSARLRRAAAQPLTQNATGAARLTHCRRRRRTHCVRHPLATAPTHRRAGQCPLSPVACRWSPELPPPALSSHARELSPGSRLVAQCVAAAWAAGGSCARRHVPRSRLRSAAAHATVASPSIRYAHNRQPTLQTICLARLLQPLPLACLPTHPSAPSSPLSHTLSWCCSPPYPPPCSVA